MNIHRFAWIAPVALSAALAAAPAWARDELAQRASWSIPAAAEVRADLQQWLEQQDLAEAVKLQAAALWPPEAAGSFEVLDRLADVLAAVDPRARQLVDFCQQPRTKPALPQFEILSDSQAAPLVRNNLKLLYARWLARHNMFNEALEQLAELTPESVADPAALLFYKGIAHYRLLQKKECLPVLAQLMENEALIPRRYQTLAQLMEADIKPLKIDSLDEVARLMDNVTRRLNLGRAGKRVRTEEEQIIAKLDKMIEEMEKQMQQQMQQGGGGQRQSSNPLPDSQPAGGTGPGEVDQRRIGNTAGWGNMPAKEREETLQEITKDLPAHYRDVIEAYFRRLARESK